MQGIKTTVYSASDVVVVSNLHDFGLQLCGFTLFFGAQLFSSTQWATVLLMLLVLKHVLEVGDTSKS